MSDSPNHVELALQRLLEEELGDLKAPDLRAAVANRRSAMRSGKHHDSTATDSHNMRQAQPSDHDDFLTASERPQGILSEFIGFMRENSAWWLTPFLIVFGLLGLVLILGATGAAPFIYAMF